MSQISILLVEDQQLVRQAWTMQLNEVPEFTVVGSCENGAEAVELARQLRPDVVLLEIDLKGMDGFETSSLIRKFAPGSNILGVSTHAQVFNAKRLIKIGALGYVTKNSSLAELVEAIKQVSQKKTYICADMKEALSASYLETPPPNAMSGLTSREMGIIEYLRKGFTSKDIGKRLGLSPKTVCVHRYNMMKKLKVKNTASLINYMSYAY